MIGDGKLAPDRQQESLAQEISDTGGSRVLTGRLLALSASIVISALVLILGILALADQANILPIGLRAAIIVIAAFTLPGIPIAALLRMSGYALNVCVAAPLSVAILELTAQTQIVAAWWHPIPAQMIIAGVSLILTIVAIRTADTRTPRQSARVIATSVAAWKARLPILAVLVIALVLFTISANRFDPRPLDPTGIISRVDVMYFISLALLASAVVIVFTSRRFDMTLGVLTLATTVVVTTMFTAIASGMASFPTAYAHRGFVGVLNHIERLPPPSDARFSWAAFFSGSAQLVKAAGLPSADPFLTWAPVVTTLVTAAPMFVIGLAITRNRRLALLGVVILVMFNWYQQDYYSPQAIAVLLYLSVIALLLWQLTRRNLPAVLRDETRALVSDWLRWWSDSVRPALRSRSRHDLSVAYRRRPPLIVMLPGLLDGLVKMVRRTPGRVPHRSARWELSMELIMVAIIAALVVEHQLTPIVAIGALTAFAFFGFTRYRYLWAVALCIFAAWFSFGARTYWYGHLHEVLGDVGQVSNSVSGGVTKRLGTDSTYTNMQYLRLISSALLAVVGFISWLVFVRKDRIWVATGFLIAIPFGLVLVQSYGGEVVIRSFVLSSPVLAATTAVLIARIFRSVSRRTSNNRTAGASLLSRILIRAREHGFALAQAIAVVCAFAVMVALVTNRGLNTSFEYTSPKQDHISQEFMAKVPRGSTVMLWWATSTLASDRLFSEVNVDAVDSLRCLDELVDCTLNKSPDYIVSAPQTVSALKLGYGFPTSFLADQTQKLIDSGNYAIMYYDPSILVLYRTDVEEVELK